MRLLLDEMYPAGVAQGLRARGHDVVAVVERPELRGTPDDEVFAAAQRERRTVVTENMRDYVPIANGHDATRQPHHGLVLVDPSKYPRGRSRTIGTMVGALDQLARDWGSDEPTSLRSWL